MGNAANVFGLWATSPQELEVVLDDWFPNGITILGVNTPNDLAALGAWANPFSLLGMATRLALVGKTQQKQTDADVQPGLDSLGTTMLEGGPWEASELRSTDSVAGLFQQPLGGAAMAQIVVPNVYRLTVEAGVGSQSLVNVFHARGTGPGQEQAAATAFQTAWKIANGPWLSVGNTAVSLRQFQAVDLSSTQGGIWTIVDNTANATAGALATAAASALVQWNGANRSRTSRGRTYLGPLRETQVQDDGRSLVGGSVTILNTAMTNFRTSMSGAGFEVGVLSRSTATWYPITRQLIAPIIATQRRRIRS